MKKQILVVLIGMLVIGTSHATDDPMKSLFLFQQKMAKHGSTAAMMKLGEMYEQGQGTSQDFDKAIEMYQKARQGGQSDADAAIARVQQTREAQIKEAAMRKQREEAARRRTEAERKAELERKAREKAQQEALARKRAEEKAQREARARAQAEQAAHAKAVEAKRKAEQARLAAARAESKVPNKTAETRQQKSEEQDSGFKSDPCKGPAARVMSICK